mmetsp:Transcript_25189/g.63963  ORF Transcript_25189/g.63963 Transcript_25189/m.63963 type:complete len:215 (+) Transcript_25189:645-1289(+)
MHHRLIGLGVLDVLALALDGLCHGNAALLCHQLAESISQVKRKRAQEDRLEQAARSFLVGGDVSPGVLLEALHSGRDDLHLSRSGEFRHVLSMVFLMELLRKQRHIEVHEYESAAEAHTLICGYINEVVGAAEPVRIKEGHQVLLREAARGGPDHDGGDVIGQLWRVCLRCTCILLGQLLLSAGHCRAGRRWLIPRWLSRIVFGVRQERIVVRQ